MRVLAGMCAVAFLVLTGCRTTPAALIAPTPSPARGPAAVSCPDGKPQQPGLTNFGSYIGTWQAHKHRDPQTSDYTIANVTGRVSVQCSAAGYVVLEVIDLTFQVPSGRAVQFALSELPADSVKIYDREHTGCRTLQYQSKDLAQQLGRDDRAGLAGITLESPSAAYNASSVSRISIQVATTVGQDARPCTLK